MEDAAKSEQISLDQYQSRMREKMDALLRGVAQAVNDAPDGAWINASEGKVRDLFAEFRQNAYETALQMRLEVTQAAFSPGGQGIGPASAQQGQRKS